MHRVGINAGNGIGRIGFFRALAHAGIEKRKLGNDVAADIGIGVTRKRRDLQRFAVRLLQPDNVRIGFLDRFDDPLKLTWSPPYQILKLMILICTGSAAVRLPKTRWQRAS